MLHRRRVVAHLDVRKGVRAALVAHEHRIALRVVPGVHRLRQHLHLAAIAVLPVARADALAHDVRLRVPADMDHLRARVGLLAVVHHRDAVELTGRVVALEDHTRVLPRDGRAGFHLRPADLRVRPRALAALGHEVVDAALSFLVARVPVLHGGVLDRRVLQRDQLDHGRMELRRRALWCGAALEVADVRALVRDDQRTFELARSLGIDPKIRRQLHRAADTLRDVDERPLGEHGGVERGKEVVGVRHHGAEILLHELGMLADSLSERAEHDAELAELLLHRGPDTHRIEDRVHRHAGQELLLVERNAELLVGAQQLRVDVLERLERRHRLGRRVVRLLLVVDWLVADVGPVGLLHRQPAAVCLEPPIQQPGGLILLRRDEANDVFTQAGRNRIRLDIRHEAVLIFAIDQRIDGRAHVNKSPDSTGAILYETKVVGYPPDVNATQIAVKHIAATF